MGADTLQVVTQAAQVGVLGMIVYFFLGLIGAYFHLWLDPDVPSSWSGPFQHYKANPREAALAVFSYVIIYVVWMSAGLHIEINGAEIIDLRRGQINAFEVAVIGYCASSLFKLAAERYTKSNGSGDVPPPDLSA
jgi:hypothetical protein